MAICGRARGGTHNNLMVASKPSKACQSSTHFCAVGHMPNLHISWMLLDGLSECFKNVDFHWEKGLNCWFPVLRFHQTKRQKILHDPWYKSYWSCAQPCDGAVSGRLHCTYCKQELAILMLPTYTCILIFLDGYMWIKFMLLPMYFRGIYSIVFSPYWACMLYLVVDNK